jgi:hypothetical protein
LESAQKELLTVLLKHVFSLGLISKTTYLSARDSVASMLDLPELLCVPVCLTKGAAVDGSTQNPG